MRSPIKTIIKNKTNSQYRSRLDDQVNLNLAPEGKSGDTVEINGDAFTLIERQVPSDMLMDSILSGKLEVTYVVDNIASIIQNTGKANFAGNAKAIEAINKANTGNAKPEETKAEEIKPIEQPKVQETAVEPVEPIVEEKPVDVEPAVENAEEPVTVSEDTTETEDKPKAEDKPKRQRKIKVD